MCMVLSITAGPASPAEVAVIANRSVTVDRIDRTLLLDVYTGEVKQWNNGEPVVLIDLKPKSTVKSAFYEFLGKSASRMKSIWMKNLLTGEGKPPESLESQADIVKMVASTPGAIGYVDSKLVTNDVITLTSIPYKEDRPTP